MFIIGAPTLRYGDIVEVIDAAKGAGVEKVGYTFTPKGQVKPLPRGATPVRLRLRDPHRRGRAVRRRPRERPDGPAPHDAQERRHRRDHHPEEPPAEPRLDEHRRHVAGAQQDQALSGERGEGARGGPRAPAAREGTAPLRPEHPDPALRSRAAARRYRIGHAEEIEELLAAVGFGKVQARQVVDKLVPDQELQEAPTTGVVSAVKRVLAGDSTRSRSAAPTTCWSSAHGAATRSAARRSSATSPEARACRCTR